jgi:hypothetical protein
MAELDKPDFKFPDEQDLTPEKDDQDDQLLIEIEDDTPIQDKNKEPLPETVKVELYNDELDDYSTKVKKKLMQMKRLAHDERREKERVFRENQEAVTIAQRLIEENKRLKHNLHENQSISLKSITKNVEMEIKEAKEEYRKAYEAGDTDKVLEAQQKISELAIRSDKIRNFKPVPLQEDESYVPIAAKPAFKPAPVDPTAVVWQKQNPWFGQDKLMTSMALALHEQLREEGVIIASDEYYKRIDGTMRHRFPDKFEDSRSQEPEKPVRISSVVAPVTRSTSPKKISLKQSQLALAKKLGLTPEQYAQAAIKLES